MDKIIRCITDDGAIAVTAAETSDIVLLHKSFIKLPQLQQQLSEDC